MIPDKPKNLTATNTTSTSVTLNWQIAFELKGFPVNFTFEMVMQSVCEPGHWKAVDVQRIKKIGDIEYSLELTNLTFAHTWYDIRLRMKSEPAENTEEMWSKQTNVTFQTLPRLPDKPPTIDRGSFNIHSNGDLYLYWRHLGKCYQNGANFNYTVEFISNGKNKKEFLKLFTCYLYPFILILGNGRPNQQTLLTAIFRKERFNTQQANVVRIWSSNGEGRSLHFSELTIPGIDDRFPEPRRIKKSLKDGEYHLSWSAPLNGNLPEVVVSYTVFWCVSKSELPNHCESSINFTHVNSSTLNVS